MSLIVAVTAMGVMAGAALLSAFHTGPLPFGAIFGQAASGQGASAPVPAPTQYVTRLVRVRSAPTSQGSAVIRSLKRGAAIDGAWITGQDGKTTWLRVTDSGSGGGFVWSRNLSGQPRPPLLATMDQDLVLTQAAAVRSEPLPDAAVVNNLQPGALVHALGSVQGDLYELALREGGVGYIPTSAVASSAAGSDAQVATPSFVCAPTAKWDERMICADAPLAAADRRIAQLYGSAMSAASTDEARTQLRSAQRNWIRQRRACENTADGQGCLRQLYQSRAGELGWSEALF